jgi:hypothetical protein
VVGRCTCGCPTIDLALSSDSHKKAASKIVADFEGATPEGLHVGVILHVREGEISELEVYPIDEATGPLVSLRQRLCACYNVASLLVINFL